MIIRALDNYKADIILYIHILLKYFNIAVLPTTYPLIINYCYVIV